MCMILDTTLREGEQTPGVYFDPHIKVIIADLLNALGIDIIEGGHPAVSDEIFSSLKKMSSLKMKAVTGAHARSMRRDIDLALECNVGFLGIFYCVSNERLNHHSKDLTQAIDIITDVIRYAKDANPGLLIRYTPEDTVRSSWENVTAAAIAAVKAGADIISIADTTGYMIPGTDRDMGSFVSRMIKTLKEEDLHPRIEVHCHNDRGFALANAIGGYQNGAGIIDASVLGLGERAGIVDLASLITVLKYDFCVDKDWDLSVLKELYEVVARYSRIPIPVNQPIIGRYAFTHCAGVHTQAAIKNPLHYQSIDPEPLGRIPEIALDHMTGLAAVKYSLNKIGADTSDEHFVDSVLTKVKEVGRTGRTIDLDELKYIIRYIS